MEIEGQTAGRGANLLLPKYDSDFVKLHIAVYALKQSYWAPHKKANLKEICRLENDLYKIAIGRILATHAQNYQIHSTHWVTRGNLYAKILNEKNPKHYWK